MAGSLFSALPMGVWWAIVIASPIVFYYIMKWLYREEVRHFETVYPEDKIKGKKKEHYDVAIVGAGPSGATCGYYLGKDGRKVLLLEKKEFPRDKYCGDAVCKTAIEILIEMGIYKKLIKENKARVADCGGLVSPSGFSYIGRSKEHLGEIPAAIACKRIHLDNEIAMAAKGAGADLKENSSVDTATFNKSEGLWTIKLDDGKTTYKARVLVCADGAPSRLALQLGLVTTPPPSNCSRSYVDGDSHQFNADGVVFYPRGLLPGYAALFRHPNNVLNYCVYIIPGNPKVTPDDLPHWHDHLMKHDPYISKALGPNFKIERMKAASLRLGGEDVSTGDHVLVVGDAAGMIDPMTGEGIHHAMEGGKIAARFLMECLEQGNYEKDCMHIYHQRWMDRFGSDFKWSMKICQILYRFPILLDAATAAVARKGDTFLARWADIMTGRVPKIHLLKPEFSITVTYELIKLILLKITGQTPNIKAKDV